MTTSFAPQLRRQLSRRAGIVVGVTSLFAAGAVGLSTPAQAADAGTLEVVGTSDVFDSHLVQDVIKPGFEAAYKADTGNDIKLNYDSQGTGAAITLAKSGAKDALIVHAASLENQFVGDGYSAEQYGRAIFYGDYVLLGPAGDPAGVLGADGQPSTDIVSAYQKIAAAGAEHKARFISRGGTPGTTVQEHAIWKLTTGVQTCTVSAAKGGGTSPSTQTGDCPASIPYPSWYKATAVTQAPNILAGDACNFADADDPSTSDCYVFTDKGTFQYLRSTNALSQLKLVAAKNAATATGGATLLINSFHAYAINPDSPGFAENNITLNNSAGAKAFLDYLTSPAAQSAINSYLANDPDGAPFLKSAAPELRFLPQPTSVPAGTTVPLRGSLFNTVPGTPALSGKTVTLLSAPANTPSAPLTAVGTGTTNSRGEFRIDYKPEQSRRYGFSTPAAAQIEDPTLSPVFGDLLAAQTVTAKPISLVTTVTGVSATSSRAKHGVFTGTASPAVRAAGPYVTLLARKAGTADYVDYGRRALPVGAGKFSVDYTLPTGRYSYRLTFAYPGSATGASAFAALTVR